MDYFRIGLFLRPHGVRGELKLLPLTDDVRRFKTLKAAFIESSEGIYLPIDVENAKASSENSVIVKLSGVETMDDAEKLRDKYLCVDRANAVKLPEGTYFISDLIGCKVESTDGTELGEMVDVYETNANDVYVIKGSRHLSVPALKRLLHTVDTVNKRIVLDADVLSEVGLFED
ncbi:MAG: 16S rRNA processing protein RimM [Christensenellaceae bacterium]|nr:16S rRNA processing protein RimM [Christensenellaceae bacterium]